MSLRVAHELGLALAITLALLSVLLGGELPAGAWLTLASPWVAMWLRLEDIVVSPLVGSALALSGFAWAALMLLEQGLDGSMLAATLALLGIVVGRLLTRRTPNHDLQGLVLSLLLVFAGTVLHQQFTYGIAFVLYAVAVTWALITRQLVEGATAEATRQGNAMGFVSSMSRRDVVTPMFFSVTAAVAVMILLSTSVLFILFPRVGLGSLGLRGRNGARMPSDVSLLGAPRALAGGTQVVARVRGVSYKAYLRGLYLRGSVYDELQLAGFRRSGSLADVRPTRLGLAPAVEDGSYEVFLEPVTDQNLLTLGPVRRSHVVSGGFANPSARARVVAGPADELVALAPLAGPLRYEVEGGIASPERAAPRPQDDSDAQAQSAEAQAEADDQWRDPAFEDHFLRLPEGIDRRIFTLAQRLAANAPTFAARAAALRKYLLEHFSYSLDQPNTGKKDPLAAFFFEDPRGHCEYFATAFATLLRAAGVPSRVVGGFAGGTWDEEGPVAIFSGNNAHVWVEWYEPTTGWVLDDATPATEAATLTGVSAWLERLRRAWDDKVVDFGIEQQMELFTGIVTTFRSPTLPTDGLAWRPIAVAILVALGVGVLLWLGQRGAARRGERPAPLTRALVAGLERVYGTALPPSWTLREAVEHTTALQMTPSDTALLWQALACYEAMRFGHAASLAVPRALLHNLRRLSRAGSV